MYKDLKVWQDSIALVKDIYKVTESFPQTEKLGITSQLQRAAVYIPANISEGAARKGHKEFTRFLYIARASAAELETLLCICHDLRYMTSDQYIRLNKQVSWIGLLLNRLIRSL